MRTKCLYLTLVPFLVLAATACVEPKEKEVKTNKEVESFLGTQPDVTMWNSASTYVTLTSQVEVDAFSCETGVLDANLVIGTVSGSDIRDLSKLACLTRIDGLLQISGTRIADLRGLHRLRVVKAGIQIDQNPSLQSLNGLSALDSLGGYFYLSNNDQLSSLAGLGPLTHIDALAIFDNDQLQNLEGLERIRTIGHAQEWFVNLHVAANKSLRSLQGLGELKQIRGGMWITDNPALESLDGIAGLDEVSGSVMLRKNGSVEDRESKSWLKKEIK
ncbi:MAG: hypothetical protein IPH16_13325 [Haliscomenobacter sp.]|nr:hypothetical protein [Haliscomenobacter sp.]MBK7477307.1 hypothetical protein [Haliscomenobacter sp.]MBK8877479.1 hypothetical protein [Haliscomenobacter sp.]